MFEWSKLSLHRNPGRADHRRDLFSRKLSVPLGPNSFNFNNRLYLTCQMTALLCENRHPIWLLNILFLAGSDGSLLSHFPGSQSLGINEISHVSNL